MYLYNPDVQLENASEVSGVTVGDLDTWQSLDDQLSVDAAAEAGFGVVKVEAGYQGRVIVRDVSMSCRRTVQGRECDIGASVRLIIKIIGLDLKGDLSLPAVSAKVELGLLRASADLRVVGVTNVAIFGAFPSFEKLDVEAFGKYTAAQDSIRKLITKDPSNIKPTLLRYLPEKVDDGDYPKAVGVVFAMKSIASGRSLDDALRECPRDWTDYYSAITDTYNTIAGIGPDGSNHRPDGKARDEARAWLSWL